MTDRVRFPDATVVANVVSLIVMFDAEVGCSAGTLSDEVARVGFHFRKWR